MKKILPPFLFMFILIVSSTLFGCKKDHEHEDDCNDTKIIKVAAMVSETGDWANLGLSSEAAIKIAIEEINDHFQNKSLPFRFELTVFDTQLNPVLAASTMKNIANAGFKLVIGPQSSSELAAVKSIADSAGILVVSQGSTASTLSIVDDFLFRFVPGDQIEGAAISNTMINQGKQAIVTIARNDAGNLGLQNSVEYHFGNLGGTVVSAGNYATTTTDFSTELTNIRNAIVTLSSTYSNSSIGVYLASFDEAVTLFNQASSDPILASVNWYGGDGFIKNQIILNDAAAAQFAIATSFFCPEFGLPSAASTIWTPLLADIYSRCGIEGDAFSLAAYDAMKVMAKMVETNNGLPTTSKLKSQFLSTSNAYFGATGNIDLNDAGDRANGSFAYWGIEQSNGTYNWHWVGNSE